MHNSIFENMINVCFKSGDILREYFESCSYTIIQKTTSFDLANNTGLSIPDGHEKIDLVVKERTYTKIPGRNWELYLRTNKIYCRELKKG